MGAFSQVLYAREEVTYMCDKLERVIVVIESQDSNAWAQVKMKTSSGSQMYSIRASGSNFDSRASQIARDLKDCKKVRFYYDSSRNGSNVILVNRAEITLLHR